MRRVRTALLALAVLGTGCGTARLHVTWPPALPVVDGRPDDWQDVTFTRLADPDVDVGVRNDARHLYVFLSTSRPGVISRILRGETTLWLDGSGGTRKTDGLRLRELREGGPTDRELAAFTGTAELDLTPDTLLQRTGGSFRMLANRVGAPDGAAMAMRLERGWLACEVRLPLEWVPGSRRDSRGRPSGTIAIGLQIEAPPAPEPAAKDERGGNASAVGPGSAGSRDDRAPGRGTGGMGGPGMGSMGGAVLGGGRRMGGAGRGGGGFGSAGHSRVGPPAAPSAETWFKADLLPAPPR